MCGSLTICLVGPQAPINPLLLFDVPEQFSFELRNTITSLAYLLTALGIGVAFLRPLALAAPAYWRYSLALLSGIAISDTFLTSALYLGGGVRTLHVVSTLLLGMGLLGIAWHIRTHRFQTIFGGISRQWWLAAIVVIALSLNCFIALAPSTKIDELHYHMVVPRRVIFDNGLRPYRQPFESAIYPQLSFQYALSAVHALRAPEAGNLISWGISFFLISLIVGTVAELTKEPQVGWLFGAVAAVGLYTAVWHVTSAPHALGDLATVIAFSLYLLPEGSVAWVPPTYRLALICLGACVAATTKISLLPAGLALSVLASFSYSRPIGWKTSISITVGIWTIMLAPSIIWSSVQTGSPFGLATATVFHSTFFDPATIQSLADARTYRTYGLASLVSVMLPSLSAGFFLALAILVASARKQASFRLALAFLAAQALLIAFFLPHDFRFLGGQQFVCLILSAWALSLTLQGRRWLLRARWLAVPLCLPWLAIQASYAGKFLPVDLGLESRQTFLARYVAFWTDFERLDRILPANAVLYVKNSPKFPGYYAPRQAIFTLADWKPNERLYQFSVGDLEEPPANVCGQIVYLNTHATSYAFRTSEPLYDKLTVQRCF